MTSYIIIVILSTFQLPYNEDSLQLIQLQLQLHEQIRPFFRVEIGASEKSTDISKIRDKKKLSCAEGQLNFRKSHNISSQYH